LLAREAVNELRFRLGCRLRSAQTYIDVWNRIKRDPRNAGVLNTRQLQWGLHRSFWDAHEEVVM
jgi:hypothetical protein